MANDNKFQIELNPFASPPSPQNARCLSAWMNDFWIPTQTRRYPSLSDKFRNEGQTLETMFDGDCGVEEFWRKQVAQALKKIVVEDLGDMNALELWESIPENDSDGRGRLDLTFMQKELSVKVVFSDNRHVLLVGQKQKLAKKCFTLRNIISHYHWRLSGKETGR